MNTKLLLLLLFISGLMACGPSDAEKQAAIEQRMQAKHDLEMQIMTLTSDIATMKKELIQGNARLEVEIDRLSRIKEWQLGRTPSEREEQISSQSITIQNLDESLESYKSSIAEKENNLTQLQSELSMFQ